MRMGLGLLCLCFSFSQLTQQFDVSPWLVPTPRLGEGTTRGSLFAFAHALHSSESVLLSSVFLHSLFASLKSKTKRDARIEDERRFGRVQRRVETRSVVSLSGFIILSAGIQRRRFLCETGLKGDNIHERRPWVFAN